MKVLNSKTIYEGKITRYELKEIELPNKKIQNYEFVEHDPAVGVIATTEDNKLLLVRQYRVGLDREILEIPAGLVDPGEEMLVAAKRELEEETAYQAKEWEELRSFYTAPGFTNAYMKLFAARNLIKVENPLPQDDNEFIEVVYLTLSEAEAAYESGEICDMKTVWALDYLRAFSKNQGEI